MKLLRRILTLMLAVMTVCAVTIPLFSLPVCAGEVSSADWMSRIPDEAKLANVNIPGTHDAGMFDSQWGTGAFSETQSLNITEQLEAGVRLMDIRLRYGGSGELYLCHGAKAYCCDAYDGGWGALSGKLTYDLVLERIVRFLDEHRDEVVLLTIQHEHEAEDEVDDEEDDDSSDFSTALTDHHKKYKDRIVHVEYSKKDRSLDTVIGSVRGKILIFPFGTGFGDMMEDKYNDYSHYGEEKWTVIHEYLMNAPAQDIFSSNSKIRAAYTSCTGQYEYDENGKSVKHGISENIPVPKGQADIVNPRLLSFNYLKGARYGWIEMDFVTEELCKRIYLTNNCTGETLTYYVSDIRGFCGDEKNNNAADLKETVRRCEREGYRLLSSDSITNVNPDGYSMVIGYKLTDNVNGAITGVIGSYGDHCPSGYTKVITRNSAYNYFTRGSGSRSENTYLYYTKASSGKPLLALTLVGAAGDVRQENGKAFNLNEGLDRTIGIGLTFEEKDVAALRASAGKPVSDPPYAASVFSGGSLIHVILLPILVILAVTVTVILAVKKKKRKNKDGKNKKDKKVKEK